MSIQTFVLYLPVSNVFSMVDKYQISFLLNVNAPMNDQVFVPLKYFCFDPHNEPATFGPEHVVELELSIEDNIDKDNSVDSSLENVLKHMPHLEKLSVCFSRDYQDNSHFWQPMLSGLEHSPNLHELDLKICGKQSNGYFYNLR